MKMLFEKPLKKSLDNLKLLIKAGLSFEQSCNLTNHEPTPTLKKKVQFLLDQQESGEAEGELLVNISVV